MRSTRVDRKDDSNFKETSKYHISGVPLPASPLASSDETVEMIVGQLQEEQATFKDTSSPAMGTTATGFLSAATRSPTFEAAWAMATTRAFGGNLPADNLPAFQTTKASSYGGQKMTEAQTAISPPFQPPFEHKLWASGDLDNNAFASYDLYGRLANVHSNSMSNCEHLDVSTAHTGSLTDLTTDMDMKDPSRQYLDHSAWPRSSPWADVSGFPPAMDQSDVANLPFHDAALHGLLCADDVSAQHGSLAAVQSARGVERMVSSPSFPPMLSCAPGSKNMSTFLPFMKPAHEETVGEAEIRCGRTRGESFGREVGGQQELAMGWKAAEPSEPCWAPGEHFTADGFTQPRQAKVEMNLPVAVESGEDANLKQKRGCSGGERELPDPIKRVRTAQSHNEQEKLRRGEIKVNLEGLKPYFSEEVLVRYSKFTQLELILGARDTMIDLKDQVAKAFDYIKVLEARLVAMSAHQPSIPPPFARQTGPFHDEGNGHPGVANEYPPHSELRELPAQMPPLMMGQRGCMPPSMHPQPQMQAHMQPQPQMQFQMPALMQPQSQMQPQPHRRAQMTSQSPALMPPQSQMQPQMPAYVQPQMQPQMMHQLPAPHAAYRFPFQSDSMTLSGSGLSGMRGQIPDGGVVVQQEGWGGGVQHQQVPPRDAYMNNGIFVRRETGDDAPLLPPLPFTSAPPSLHYSVSGGRMSKRFWGNL